jgi:nucleotidyltransferase AbiEii toxin of type IV toxin-antitoxin system
VRAMFDARLGTIRERLQVDIGFGDALLPHDEEMAYPVALGDPSPLIRVYSPETVIAEKLEAIVSLGIRNSRIKDFFDIDYLARSGRFDRAVLGRSGVSHVHAAWNPDPAGAADRVDA